MRQQSQNNRTGFVIAAIAAMALIFGPGIAEAGRYKNKYHSKHHGKHYGSYHSKPYKRYYKHNDGAAIVLGALGVLGWALHSDGYNNNKHYVAQSRRHKRRHWKHASNYNQGYQSSCHQVKKRGYWRGHRAKIGGTACVDDYGNRYVLNGSRYLNRYLY